jgi:hypothetical protein
MWVNPLIFPVRQPEELMRLLFSLFSRYSPDVAHARSISEKRYIGADD